ncbi:hypothetical protein [Streptomyces sp. NBC_00996]|uniref:hypothetical protein n=1 Tax=Streptomyces sp. NBC_00996 TaxID=2903710 RepID=UPI00386F508A|nr:hypothetical protein OG390_04355 [Streptomyces sp. NBC_00996]
MNCVHCGRPLPEGSRRDRAYCDNKCFNLSHTTASRYAAIAQNLLDDQIEQTSESE